MILFSDLWRKEIFYFRLPSWCFCVKRNNLLLVFCWVRKVKINDANLLSILSLHHECWMRNKGFLNVKIKMYIFYKMNNIFLIKTWREKGWKVKVNSAWNKYKSMSWCAIIWHFFFWIWWDFPFSFWDY